MSEPARKFDSVYDDNSKAEPRERFGLIEGEGESTPERAHLKSVPINDSSKKTRFGRHKKG
jgi:hypothetical protein